MNVGSEDGVLIIGAGLAGLCCARHLTDHGVDSSNISLLGNLLVPGNSYRR